MSRERAAGCLARGDAVAAELAAEGFGIVALGEMGIGNTTSASALVAALLGVEPGGGRAGAAPASTTRRLARKVEVVARRSTAKPHPTIRSARSPRSAGSRSRSSPA